MTQISTSFIGIETDYYTTGWMYKHILSWLAITMEASWETYNGADDTAEHIFSSSGNRLRCKLVANGDVSKECI